jgi:hypothetical protein
MKNFLFICALFFPIVIFAQQGKTTFEYEEVPYALNDIGEEYHITRTIRVQDSLQSTVYDTRILADLSELSMWITDSTMTDDIQWLRAHGAFAVDFRYGIFVYHDETGVTNVFKEPTKIIRIEHRRSSSIYYKYVWGECHDEKNNYVPEMVLEVIHRWGKTCLIATACGETQILNFCNDQEIEGLWDVYSSMRTLK